MSWNSLQKFFISKNQISLLYLPRAEYIGFILVCTMQHLYLASDAAANFFKLIHPVSVMFTVKTLSEGRERENGLIQVVRWLSLQIKMRGWHDWISLAMGKNESSVSKLTWNSFIVVWKRSLCSVCNVSLFTKPLFSVWANQQPLWSYFHWPNTEEKPKTATRWHAKPGSDTPDAIYSSIQLLQKYSCLQIYSIFSCIMAFHIKRFKNGETWLEAHLLFLPFNFWRYK